MSFATAPCARVVGTLRLCTRAARRPTRTRTLLQARSIASASEVQDKMEKASLDEPSGLHLYTTTSPNGWKASIVMEELGLQYTTHQSRPVYG